MFIHIIQVHYYTKFTYIAKFPVYWSTKSLVHFLTEAVGPEPVSPHYESYVRSRRYIVITALAIIAYRTVEQLNLNSFYGQHALYEVYTLTLMSIGVFESRYILQKLPA
jgi:hypothetical protein